MMTFDLPGYDVRGPHSRMRISHVVLAGGDRERMAGAGVSRVRELLAQAVQCLDDSGGTSSQPQASQPRASQPHSSGDSRGTPRANPGPPSTSSRFTTPLSSRPSVLAERNFLFNYGGGGKRNVGKVNGNRKSKKKRLTMWTHDFVCLARADQKKTPTAVERSKLISAGTMGLHLSSIAFFSLLKSIVHM